MPDLFKDIGSLLFKSGRSIGSVIPDVAIRERHNDSVSVTQHPVEQGAAITDHAFVNPAQLEMEIGFSDASFAATIDNVTNFNLDNFTNANGQFFSSILNGSFGENYTGKMYQALLLLMRSREPVQIVTRKRVYQNMLITNLSVETNPQYEYAGIFRLVAQEVLIVSTNATTLSDISHHNQPQVTAPIQNLGVNQVQPLSNRSPFLPGTPLLSG